MFLKIIKDLENKIKTLYNINDTFAEFLKTKCGVKDINSHPYTNFSMDVELYMDLLNKAICT
jgi:hypothetical protein